MRRKREGNQQVAARLEGLQAEVSPLWLNPTRQNVMYETQARIWWTAFRDLREAGAAAEDGRVARALLLWAESLRYRQESVTESNTLAVHLPDAVEAVRAGDVPGLISTMLNCITPSNQRRVVSRYEYRQLTKFIMPYVKSRSYANEIGTRLEAFPDEIAWLLCQTTQQSGYQDWDRCWEAWEATITAFPGERAQLAQALAGMLEAPLTDADRTAEIKDLTFRTEKAAAWLTEQIAGRPVVVRATRRDYVVSQAPIRDPVVWVAPSRIGLSERKLGVFFWEMACPILPKTQCVVGHAQVFASPWKLDVEILDVAPVMISETLPKTEVPRNLFPTRPPHDARAGAPARRREPAPQAESSPDLLAEERAKTAALRKDLGQLQSRLGESNRAREAAEERARAAEGRLAQSHNQIDRLQRDVAEALEWVDALARTKQDLESALSLVEERVVHEQSLAAASLVAGGDLSALLHATSRYTDLEACLRVLRECRTAATMPAPPPEPEPVHPETERQVEPLTATPPPDPSVFHGRTLSIVGGNRAEPHRSRLEALGATVCWTDGNSTREQILPLVRQADLVIVLVSHMSHNCFYDALELTQKLGVPRIVPTSAGLSGIIRLAEKKLRLLAQQVS